MKSLSDLILEAEDQQMVIIRIMISKIMAKINKIIKQICKGDAGTFKQWPAFETTVKDGLKSCLVKKKQR